MFCRFVGKYTGVWLGAKRSGVDLSTRNWIGLALMPMAEVEIGMALIPANKFLEFRQVLLTVVISATIIFELFGQLLIRHAIKKVEDHH